MKRKICDPCHEKKKSNEKCTVLSSNDWKVRRYYNTDLAQTEIARPSVVPRSIYANHRQPVWWIYPTRQNIKITHDACIGTSFGQCLKANQRTSVHVWRKIAHVRPPQTTQCIPYKLPLNRTRLILSMCHTQTSFSNFGRKREKWRVLRV
jgi:hypothetical protein